MDWPILLFVIPAVVVPVVLLIGFAGCSFEHGVLPLEPPEIILAAPYDSQLVRLEWTHVGVDPVRYEIIRNPAFASPPANPTSPYMDSGLEEGTEYSYRVRVVRLSDGESADSNEAVAVTWTAAFLADLEGAGQDVDASNSCLIQRFEPGTLSRSGNLIRITGQSAGSGVPGQPNVTLARLTISRGNAGPAGDPYDSVDDPVVIFDQPIVAVPGSSFALTPPRAEYSLDNTQPLLIALVVGVPGSVRSQLLQPGSGLAAYTKTGTPAQMLQESVTRDRSGFAQRPDEVMIVNKIEVATQWKKA